MKHAYKHMYTHTNTKAERHKKTFAGDGYGYHLSCDVQTHEIVYIKYMQLFFFCMSIMPQSSYGGKRKKMRRSFKIEFISQWKSGTNHPE